MHKKGIFAENIFKRKQEMKNMIKKIAWNTFKNTGNIDTFLEFKQVQDIEEDIIKVKDYENGQDKRNNNG